VEKLLARKLSNNENVKLFVKLPSWSRTDTPVGLAQPQLGLRPKARLIWRSAEGEPEDHLRSQALSDLGENYDVVTLAL